MGLRLAELILSVFLHVVHYSCADDGRPCNGTVLYPCPDGQKCMESTGHCGCLQNLIMSGDTCVVPEPANSGHVSIIAVALVFVTALMAGGLLLIVRKYHLMEWARRRLEARRNRDVLYEDVMIGQDDPPLTP